MIYPKECRSYRRIKSETAILADIRIEHKINDKASCWHTYNIKTSLKKLVHIYKDNQGAGRRSIPQAKPRWTFLGVNIKHLIKRPTNLLPFLGLNWFGLNLAFSQVRQLQTQICSFVISLTLFSTHISDHWSLTRLSSLVPIGARRGRMRWDVTRE